MMKKKKGVVNFEVAVIVVLYVNSHGIVVNVLVC